MAKLKSKGTVLKQTISASLAAVAQVISISTSGTETETFDATCLDSGVGKEYQQTGYAEGGSVDFELFYDVDLAGHQAITDLVTTPADCVWSITYTDGTPFEEQFTAAGLGIGRTIAMNDGVKMSVSLKVDGLPTYST